MLRDVIPGTDLYKGYCKVRFWKGKKAETPVAYASGLGRGGPIGHDGQPGRAKLWTEVSRLYVVSTAWLTSDFVRSEVYNSAFAGSTLDALTQGPQ